MGKFKRWEYQVAIAAPFLPWVYIHYVDFLYNTAQDLGYEKFVAGFAAAMLTIAATVSLVVALVKFHENDA